MFFLSNHFSTFYLDYEGVHYSFTWCKPVYEIFLQKKNNNKFLSLGGSWLVLNKELKQHRRRRLRKRLLKSEVALLQTLSHLFHVVQSVKCWHFFLELNSKRLYRSSGKEKESRCVQVLHIFTSYSCIDGKEIYKKA